MGFIKTFDQYQEIDGNYAKDESQNGCYKKTKHAKFHEKRTNLNPSYPHVREHIRG